MTDRHTRYINEEFYAESVSGISMDGLWADGWRHFGMQFFRYSLGFHDFDIRRVIPLRIRLEDFSLSKSQRRVLRKNAEMETVVQPTKITAETENLFALHKDRFKQGIPDSIYDFISGEPSEKPCEALEITVYDNGKLIAASFFDLGAIAISGVYAMFEPSMHAHSLGIFTMLKEIEIAIQSGKTFYYLGYCYEGESFYDYKKRFRGIETFDWNGNWKTEMGPQRGDAEREN